MARSSENLSMRATGGSDTNTTKTSTQSNYKTNTTTVDLLSQDQIDLLDKVIQETANRAGQTAQLNNAAKETLLTQLQGNTLTRDQALVDSQGLIQGAARTLAEGSLKDISLQSQGAGASQDALGILLGNDARARTAEAVGQQRGDLVAKYVSAGGQATSGIASALASLSSADNQSAGALAQLFQTLKGAHSSTVNTGMDFQSSVDQTATATTEFQPSVSNSGLHELTKFGGRPFGR